jgi:hypothetical protein
MFVKMLTHLHEWLYTCGVDTFVKGEAKGVEGVTSGASDAPQVTFERWRGVRCVVAGQLRR